MVAAVANQPVITVPAPVRRDTPERWMRASERAQIANVIVTPVEPDLYRVTSASHPGVEYECTIALCSCEASFHGDPVCLHRAAVRDYIEGQKPCVWCQDTGIYASALTNWDAVRCECQKALEPVTPAPEFDPIAERELADALAALAKIDEKLAPFNFEVKHGSGADSINWREFDRLSAIREIAQGRVWAAEQVLKGTPPKTLWEFLKEVRTESAEPVRSSVPVSAERVAELQKRLDAAMANIGPISGAAD